MPAPGQSRIHASRATLRANPRAWLVTGAAGFIGSNIVAYLLDLGQRVVGLDDFSTGTQANVDDVLAAAPDDPDFVMYRGDVRDPEACAAAVRGVDFVLHQAAIASVIRSVEEPAATAAVNVDGFVNVMHAARAAGVTRVVYASSCAVYGDAAELPARESGPTDVMSPYAASKLSDEIFAAAFRRSYGFDSVGLRYFNVFGPRQDPHGGYAAVIPAWIAAMLEERTCTIYGDGRATRDFTAVRNVVEANVLAALSDPASRPHDVFNVGCGHETDLLTLFSLIRLGVAATLPHLADVAPVHAPARPAEILRSCADVSRARAELGFDAAVDIGQGLAETVGWFVRRARTRDASVVTSPRVLLPT